jgi:hypothetical protein
LQKTKMCPDFTRGKCQNSNCSFAHGVNEIKNVSFCYKTSPCIWFAKGKCRNGALCRFSHGEQDLGTEGLEQHVGNGSRVVVPQAVVPQELKPQEKNPQQALKSEPQLIKSQLQHMEPQHVGLPMHRPQFMGNGYAPQNGTSFGLTGKQLDGDLSSLYCAPMPHFEAASRLSPDLASPDDSPFLGTLMGLQSRLNDISRINDGLGLQCRRELDLKKPSNVSMDAQKVQLGNPWLSEQAINSHQVQMLSQHIKSLTSQVRKLQESINPPGNSNSSNVRTLSTQSGSALSSTDDSSSNTRSTPPPNREHALAIGQIG